MKFLYYYEKGNETLSEIADIKVDDIIKLAQDVTNVDYGIIEMGITINNLLPNAAGVKDTIMVWINPNSQSVDVDQCRYDEVEEDYIVENVEELEISQEEIEMLLLFEENDFLLNQDRIS